MSKALEAAVEAGRGKAFSETKSGLAFYITAFLASVDKEQVARAIARKHNSVPELFKDVTDAAIEAITKQLSEGK